MSDKHPDDKRTDHAGRPLPAGLEALSAADAANPFTAHIMRSAGIASAALAHAGEHTMRMTGCPVAMLPHLLATALGDMIGCMAASREFGPDLLRTMSADELARLTGDAMRANVLNAHARTAALLAAEEAAAAEPLNELLRARAAGTA